MISHYTRLFIISPYRDHSTLTIFHCDLLGDFFRIPANPGPKPIIPLHITLPTAKLFSRSLFPNEPLILSIHHPSAFPRFCPPSAPIPLSHSADRSERSTGVTLGRAVIVHVNTAREGWRERKRDGDGYCVLKSANSGPGPAPPWFSPTSKLSKHTPPNVSPLILTHTPLLHPWVSYTQPHLDPWTQARLTGGRYT